MNRSPKRILLTGAAGFLGSHVAEALVRRGDDVVGLDNLHPYYDPALKNRNLEDLRATAREVGGEFRFVRVDVRDREGLGEALEGIDTIVHLAAMVGVGPSLDAPEEYYDVNVRGTLNVLDAAAGRVAGVPAPIPVVFASTSSVYGATERVPFDEADPCDRPVAPYAASKRAAEMLGFTYHHLHGVPFTGLRLFTVYGPRVRPDMMAFRILQSAFLGSPITLYDDGQMYRDWTYVDDVVSGILNAVDRTLGYELVNLGCGRPVLLADFVRLLEKATGRKVARRNGPVPPTDMRVTHARIDKAAQLLDYRPSVAVEDGVQRLVEWYVDAVQ